jgi:hypothetical protein
MVWSPSLCTVTCGGASPRASRGCDDGEDVAGWLSVAEVSAEVAGEVCFVVGAGAGGATAFTPGSFIPGGGGAGGNWLADDWASALDAAAIPSTTSHVTDFMGRPPCRV